MCERVYRSVVMMELAGQKLLHRLPDVCAFAHRLPSTGVCTMSAMSECTTSAAARAVVSPALS